MLNGNKIQQFLVNKINCGDTKNIIKKKLTKIDSDELMTTQQRTYIHK